MTTHILITGGAGYIGSHTGLALLQAGYRVTIIDNFSNSSLEALTRIHQLAGVDLSFIEGDITDTATLSTLFNKQDVDAVIHFAGLKAVGESVSQPLRYYHNNVTGTLNLLKAMDAADVRSFIFSSSATVYGDPQQLPIPEDAPRSATNPYGRSKLMIEEMLEDLYLADSRWRIGRLRYFNPVGAHVTGLIGEDPRGIPNNLMPFISQVAAGTRECLSVFGNDYPTPDGTGVRDYIHVLDLAAGHLAALRYIVTQDKGELLTVNLGTGRGFSVFEMVSAFEKASGQQIPYKIVGRRPGDIASCYADPTLAERLLGWKATRGLEEMCVDTWRWQNMNPRGYGV